LGKPFRESSGTAIYNQVIHGSWEITDLVAPFVGEVYLDFNLPGVILAFFLLGWGAHRLQRASESPKSSFDLFVWNYLAIWEMQLIYGSADCLSQFCIIFTSPIFFYFIYRRLFLVPRHTASPHARPTRGIGGRTT
jgi:hypothetical protein